MKNGSRISSCAPAASPRRKASLLLAAMALLFFRSLPLWGWDSSFYETYQNSISPRAAAMGGEHCALADDADTLFTNPAGLHLVGRALKVAEMTLNFYDAAAEIAGETFTGGSGSTADRDATYSLWGPLAFSFVGRGWGLGVFYSTNLFLNTWDPIPGANEEIEENIVLIGAKSFRLPLPEKSRSTLDLGCSVVAFGTTRGWFGEDIRGVVQGSATIEDLLASSGYFRQVIGAGLELGILYSYRKLFSVGITGRNLAIVQQMGFDNILDSLNGEAADVLYQVRPLDVSIGFSFRPPLGRLKRVLTDLVIAADYHDMFDFLIWAPGATHPLLHFGAGLELKLLEIVSLRAGYYQCLPSFGLGLDLTLFTLNLAYFGRELSNDPGGNPVYCYTVGLEFSY